MTQQRQIGFLQNIQNSIDTNISFVNDLADLLEISNDSAYRRLRGETSLTFDELCTICKHYQISFDSFNSSVGSNVVSFQYQSIVGSKDNFRAYFEGLSGETKRIKEANVDVKEIIYAGQGMPIFHYFKYPLLGAYKMFYWMRSIMNVEGMQNEIFRPDVIDDELVQLGQSLFKDYLAIPSTEIWTDTMVMGSIHQIKFYWESGMFVNADLALEVCADLRALLGYIQVMCQRGKKQDDFDQPTIYGASLKLYYSEIDLEQVCALVNLGDSKRVYLGQLTFASIFTDNQEYYQETRNWLDSIIRKSNLISEASETTRFQFFNRCLKNLDMLEQKIKDES